MAGDRPISVDRLSRALGALEWDLYDLAQAVDRAGGREPADVLRPGKDKKIEPVPESEREDRLRSLFELLGGDDFELVIRRREDQP